MWETKLMMFGNEALWSGGRLYSFPEWVPGKPGGHGDSITLMVLLSNCPFTCSYRNIHERS